MNFIAATHGVYNRGNTPVLFLTELVDCIRGLSEELFAANDRDDIYSSVLNALGPWQQPPHRRAVMCEVLRVDAGFESSWNWNEGVDTTNASSNTALTEETGIFQVSANSMFLDDSLRVFAASILAPDDPAASPSQLASRFIAETKTNHPFAIEYAIRLFRVNIAWSGPVESRQLHPWLNRNAVAEFMRLLS